EVNRIAGGGPLPFNVSIPGVDPKRMYALIFPVVFHNRPVKPGDTWTYSSELLGGEGAKPQFTATVLKPDDEGGKNDVTRIREVVSMIVDQRLDAEKHPVKEGGAVHKTRKGKIEGSGVLNFSREQGRFTRGVM